MLASHDGYRRLGVRHERLASVTEDDRWEIADDLIFRKPGEHMLRLHWLLLDGDWTIKEGEADLQLRLRTPAGWIRLNVTGSKFSSPGFEVTLVRAGRVLYGTGQPLPYEGWFSPTYGEYRARVIIVRAGVFIQVLPVCERVYPSQIGGRARGEVRGSIAALPGVLADGRVRSSCTS